MAHHHVRLVLGEPHAVLQSQAKHFLRRSQVEELEQIVTPPSDANELPPLPPSDVAQS